MTPGQDDDPVSSLGDQIAAMIGHVEESAVVIGWVGVVAYQTPQHEDGGCTYVLLCPPGQTYHGVIGLLWRGLGLIDEM